MLLFLKKEKKGKTLEPAMNNEDTMGISAKQDISRGLLLPILKKPKSYS